MKKILIGSILLVFICLLFSNPKQTKSSAEPFKLIHSDKLLLNKINNEYVMELFGNVDFLYGKTEFKCNRSIIFDTQKIAKLFGNVVIQNDTLSLMADSVAYYRIPDKLNLGGKVYITERNKQGVYRTFKSQYATYDKLNDIITTWENVEAVDKQENAVSTCGYGYWDRKNQYAYLIEKPDMWVRGDDTLHISSEKIEYYEAERKLIATFNVKVETKDYQITSDFLLYFIEEEKAVFNGNPIFASDFASAKAVEFFLYLHNRELTRAELRDSCLVYFAEEKKAKQTNWVVADNVILHFQNRNLSRFNADGKVSYLYRQEKKEKRDFMHNESNGESLEAIFNDDNKLNNMMMKKTVKGIYKFHNNS